MKSATFGRIFFVSLTGLVTTVAFQNCSPMKFNANSSSFAKGFSDVGDGMVVPTPKGQTTVGQTTVEPRIVAPGTSGQETHLPTAAIPTIGRRGASVPRETLAGTTTSVATSEMGFCHLVARSCEEKSDDKDNDKDNDDRSVDSDNHKIGQHKDSDDLDSDKKESCGNKNDTEREENELNASHTVMKSTVRLVDDDGVGQDVCMTKNACSLVQHHLSTTRVRLSSENEEDDVQQVGEHNGEFKSKLTEFIRIPAARCASTAVTMTDEQVEATLKKLSRQ